MSEDDAEKLFLQEKPALALLFIGLTEKTYASVISKEIDSTFAHTTRILSKMEECGLIRFTYEGRIKFVELPGYGKRVEAALKEFRNLLQMSGTPEEISEEGNGEAEERNGDYSTASSYLSLRENSVAAAPEVLRERPEDINDAEAGEANEANEANRNIKELDPVNAGILERIQALHNRIENIYGEAVEKGESRDSVARKLGPFSRDIGKLQALIEETEGREEEGGRVPSIDNRVKDALGKTLKFLESCLRP